MLFNTSVQSNYAEEKSMRFKAFISAFICLSVLSLNSHAAPPSELDQLIESSEKEAQLIVAKKIENNRKLIVEITQLEEQIRNLKSDVAVNSADVRRDLYIAAGSVLGTMIALKYFGRGTGNEVADSFRIVLGILSAYAGAGTTVVSLGASGINYLQVKVDQKNLALLELRLADLKRNLIAQNTKLMN